MRRKRDLSNTRILNISPELTKCPNCSSRLISSHRKKRYIVCLKETVMVVSPILRCTNPLCSLSNHAIRPAQEYAMAIPHYTFGIDVLCFIGGRRFRDNRSIPDIHKELRGSYKVDISEREVEYLTEVYLALLTSVAKHDKDMLATLHKQGALILSIDGVQPEKGNETLYIIRDLISGLVLVARNLVSSTTEEIEKLLKEVLELGIPVKGVISDKQHSIVLAVANIFKGVPHQICQFHYIRDVSSPIVEEDRNFCKELRKTIRGVRRIERSIEQYDKKMPAQKVESLKDICVAIRTVMNSEGKYPLQPRGLRLLDKMCELYNAIEAMRSKEDHPILKSLSQMVGKVSGFQNRYLEIQESFKVLHKIVRLLDVNPGEMSDQEARRRLETFASEISGKGNLLKKWKEHIVKITNAFAPGLFSYLKEPLLPRVNNEMETFIGSIKVAGRKIRGRKNIHEFILRNGHAIAILRSLPNNLELESRIPEVPEKIFRTTLAILRRQAFRSKQYLAKTNLKEFLNGIVQQW